MKNVSIEELISLMFMAGRLMREQTVGHGNHCSLSVAQIKILSIAREGNLPTMKEVANSLLITSPSATAAINQLVKNGHLERVPDKNDRRIIRLKITAKGKKTFDDHFKIFVDKIGEVLKNLNTQEKAAFAGIFKKIINAYQR